MTNLDYLEFDLCLPPKVLKSIRVKCLGRLSTECTMLTFVIRGDMPTIKLKEKKLLLDCCKMYKAIVKKMPEYKGFYGHISLGENRTHYVESFDEMERELMLECVKS